MEVAGTNTAPRIFDGRHEFLYLLRLGEHLCQLLQRNAAPQIRRQASNMAVIYRDGFDELRN
jgi:hypothetical protein